MPFERIFKCSKCGTECRTRMMPAGNFGLRCWKCGHVDWRNRNEPAPRPPAPQQKRPGLKDARTKVSALRERSRAIPPAVNGVIPDTFTNSIGEQEIVSSYYLPPLAPQTAPELEFREAWGEFVRYLNSSEIEDQIRPNS